jgi:hypothetical protein
LHLVDRARPHRYRLVAWISTSTREENTRTTSINPAPTVLAGQRTRIEIDVPSDHRVERALAGYLAGHSGTTLVGYRLDLRQWVERITKRRTDVLATGYLGGGTDPKPRDNHGRLAEMLHVRYMCR